MDPETTVAELAAAGVFERDAEDAFSVSSAFRDRADTYERQLDDATAADRPELFADETSVENPALVAVAERSPVLGARYLALEAHAPELGVEERVRALLVLDRFLGESPPDDGVPDAFHPIRGERFHALLPVLQRSVVYVWLDDCEPCDEMRETFDDLFAEPPADLALLSVYGPECPELLHTEYDIVGGPVTLFAADGEIESRLVGSHYHGVIEDEIVRLRADRSPA